MVGPGDLGGTGDGGGPGGLGGSAGFGAGAGAGPGSADAAGVDAAGADAASSSGGQSWSGDDSGVDTNSKHFAPSAAPRPTRGTAPREVQLLGPAEIRELAAQLDIRPTKRLGQNFVIDPNTIRKIVSAAGITADSQVVEVGPGLGSLTLGIIETGANLEVVEIDERLAAQLPLTLAKFAPGVSVPVVVGDGMTVTELPFAPDALVANLPYSVSVPLLLHFLQTFPSLRTGLVMVQSEVAERVAAGPGSKIYGVPSLKAAWYGSWSIVGRVGRKVFWPVPGVDSALLRFDATESLSVATPAGTVPADRAPTDSAPADSGPVGTARGDEALRERTFALIDAAFGNRRKTLRQSLSSVTGSPAASEALLVAAGIPPTERAEKLDLDQFIKIARAAQR